MSKIKTISLIASVLSVFTTGLVRAEESAEIPDRFRVCADPYSLPSSNKAEEGYENKIAALFAKEMGVPVEFEWFPQRIGFIRNTLKNNDTEDGRYKCDIVMGVNAGFEQAATTRPYFRSSWSMVYVKDRGLDFVKSQDDLKNLSDDQKKMLRIGIFDRSPATEFVFNQGLMDQAFPYQIMMGDARAYPGQIIEEDLVDDEINLTFVWGPIAGYFAQQVEKEKGLNLAVIPMMNEDNIKFDHSITMAVRYGEKAWKDKVNAMIEKHQDEINKILTDYRVPLLELKD
jgi:quinoprotein dehydrogenase-associated probable ABC transporter substrate-binding protein